MGFGCMKGKAISGVDEDAVKKVKAPENMVIVNPDAPLYGTEHICVYLSEIQDISADGHPMDNQIEPAVQKDEESLGGEL